MPPDEAGLPLVVTDVRNLPLKATGSGIGQASFPFFGLAGPFARPTGPASSRNRFRHVQGTNRIALVTAKLTPSLAGLL